MDLERERRFNELLLEALSVPPAERRARLVQLEGAETDIVQEILHNLEADLGQFLADPAVLAIGEEESERNLEIGPFTLVERLGAGGMGEVWRARQEGPVRRDVALKLIRTHLHGSSNERFLREQSALARLQHTNIARFFEAGTTEHGEPWFTMELIGGLPLTSYCDRSRCDLEQRLHLFLQVCAGVEHAHQNQLIHRDLKPSNVLVAEEDGAPLAKIIDFGIAKILSRSDAAPKTSAGMLGTPSYMSPESLSNQDGEQVDTRSDIYSLGILLFELLTGTLPFQEEGPDLFQLIRRRREIPAILASQRLKNLDSEHLAEIAQRRSTTPSKLRRMVEQDLDWVVGKALEPNRERRYASVGELAADVRRFLGDEPVVAKPPSVRYRLGKLLRRHRLLAVALAGLCLGAAGLILGFARAREEAAIARAALKESEEVSNFMIGLFQVADPTRRENISAQELLDRGAEQIPQRLEDQPVARGRFLQTIADVYVQMGHYDQAEPMLLEAAQLLERHLKPENPSIASSIRSLGVLHSHRGEWTEAEHDFRRALDLMKLDDDPEQWALACHNLGVAVYRQGKLDEAETLFRRAYEARREHLEADHPHLARSTNALGALLLSRDRPGEALPFLRASLKHREDTLGADHPHVAKSLINLAQAEEALHGPTAARPLLQRARSIETRSLGSDHPDTERAVKHLRRVCKDLQDLRCEEEALIDLAAVSKRKRGAQAEESGRRTLVLADFYLTSDRLDEAEKHYLEGKEIYATALPSDHIKQTNPRLGLAAVMWKRGHHEKAEILFRQILSEREAHYGPEHRFLLYPMRGLAGILRDRGQLTEAEALYCRALGIYAALDDRAGSWEQRVRSDFAVLLERAERADEARAVKEQRQICSPS